jgi:hypothetical protein
VDRLTVATARLLPRALAAQRQITHAGYRHIHHAEHRHAVFDQCDIYGEFAVAVHKLLGAVERIG